MGARRRAREEQSLCRWSASSASPGARAARLLVKTRQAAKELGITFHVGSQTVTPEAYAIALNEVHKLIVKAGVVVERIDVGGGFPSRYSNEEPAPLADFMQVIRRASTISRSVIAAA